MENQKQPEQALKGEKTSQAGFYRLCISLLILGAALILRTFYPDQTREFLHKTVAGGMDYTVLLGDVGGGIRAFVLGVPHPDDALVEAVAGGPDAPDAEEPPPIDEEPAELEETPAIGGFDTPILWADARYFVSDLNYEDDTLPLPFGFSQPEKVDYTLYDLPFQTVLPAAGEMSSPFGYRLHPILGDWRFHYGVDIAGASGEPISAFADGTVLAVGWDAGYGNYLFIEHEDDFVTLYAHCQKVNVKNGQTVKAGQNVATIGSTGLSTGPHLHFELRRKGDFLDASNYLK